MVGTKLKELRNKQGFTISQLCNKLHINPNTYAKYERDERDVSTETLASFADFYGVTTDYLLGREEKKAPGMTPDDLSMESELLDLYRSMPPELRKILCDGIRSVVLSHTGAPEELEGEIQTVLFEFLSIHKASAGCGYDLNDSDQWTTVEVIDTPELRRADFAVEVDGDSMLPMFESGDIVYVIKTEEVPEGYVGLFQQNGKGYIKKVGADRLISINPDYDDIFPQNGEIAVFGIVIGKALTQ
ncbi:MAG: LexA family transcriptional regulator [Ruminococcus sp.]|nr:LexA family transcriptional regulator [Ruminococcus sp.]